LLSTRKYDVYGAIRGSSGPSGTRHKFVGQLGHSSDDETGLIYMRARYMDPVTGRFVSEDPAQNGANWFIYADNNPVNSVDFDGQMTLSDVLGALNSFLIRIYNTAVFRQALIWGIFGGLGSGSGDLYVQLKTGKVDIWEVVALFGIGVVAGAIAGGIGASGWGQGAKLALLFALREWVLEDLVNDNGDRGDYDEDYGG